MLIINADDYGRNRSATDNTLSCLKNRRITSASGMMFMADTERSAHMGLERYLDVGLHLNFTEQFTGNVSPRRLVEYHGSIAAFLRRNKYMFLVYNPMLSKCFDYVFKAQYEEYIRLFNRIPSHFDGHHHMHLCTNMILGSVIPQGSGVRRNFSFLRGEKSLLNRFYRRTVDAWLKRGYLVTDFFFGLPKVEKAQLLNKVTNLSMDSDVELMVHPETDFDYLISREYAQMLSSVRMGTYHDFCRTEVFETRYE